MDKVVAMSTPYALAFGFVHVAGRATAPSHLDAPTSAYWASSICSTIHGVYVSIRAWQTLTSDSFYSSEDLRYTTAASHHCCHVFIGYLVADLLPLAYYGRTRAKAWKGWEPYMAHHLLAILCWTLMARIGHLHAWACGMLLLEATTPFSNGRWFLATLGKTEGSLYIVNGLALAVSFLLLRVLFMGYLFVRYVVILRHPFFSLPLSTTLPVLGCFAFGYPIQLFWFSKIVRGALKALAGGGGGAKPRKAA